MDFGSPPSLDKVLKSETLINELITFCLVTCLNTFNLVSKRYFDEEKTEELS